MDSNSYREDFIQNNFKSDDYALINNFFKRVAVCEKQHGKTLEEGYTQEDYTRLMSSLGVTTPSAFRSIKTKLKKYLEQLKTDGIIPAENYSGFENISYDMIEISSVLKNRFFKDFIDLQSELDMVIRAADKIDNAVFYPAFSAVYLAWCGLTWEETLNVKREDVGENYVNIGSRTIIPNSTIMEYLNKYKNASVYFVQMRSQSALWYKDSPWLMRTNRSEHISRSSLMPLINRLSMYDEVKMREWNKETKEYEDKTIKRNRGITYEKVYWSGVFYRAYIYEGQNGKISTSDKEIIAGLFSSSKGRKAADSFKLYQEYKNYFYPNRS